MHSLHSIGKVGRWVPGFAPLPLPSLLPNSSSAALTHTACVWSLKLCVVASLPAVCVHNTKSRASTARCCCHAQHTLSCPLMMTLGSAQGSCSALLSCTDPSQLGKARDGSWDWGERPGKQWHLRHKCMLKAADRPEYSSRKIRVVSLGNNKSISPLNSSGVVYLTSAEICAA